MNANISLNQIHTFYFAATHLSFQKAADSLYVSPSAVSHQIRNLESQVGRKLFLRMDKSVALTPKGKAFFDDIRLPIEQINHASKRLLSKDELTVLTISVAPVFAAAWLLPKLAGFYRKYPQYSLNVLASTDLVDLNSGIYDAVIRLSKTHKISKDEFTFPLADMHVIAVGNPRYYDTSTSLTPQDLQDKAKIENLALPGLWKQWFEGAGIAVDKNMTTSFSVQSASQVLDTAKLTDAVGLVDVQAAKPSIRNNELIQLGEYVWKSDRQYMLHANRAVKETKIFSEFCQWLQDDVLDLAK